MKPYICEQGFSVVCYSFRDMNALLQRLKRRAWRESFTLLRLPTADVRLELRARNTLAWGVLQDVA